jgi:thiamine monophosphate kinase
VEIDEAALPVAAAAREASRRDGESVLTHVLADGEDFELLLAIDPSAAETLLKEWTHSTRLTRIGRMVPEAAGRSIKRTHGRGEALPNVGYEHKTES